MERLRFNVTKEHKMTNKKIVPALLVLAMLGLAGCSSSWGDGSPPPNKTTVVVPPNSSTTTTNYSTTTSP